MNDLETFIKAYIECALWSSVDGDGTPLDDSSYEGALSAGAMATMADDATDFYNSFHTLFDGQYGSAKHSDAELAGHDFWLTRNGHGAGFWDGDLPEKIGNELTEMAEAYGSADLYVGDDGLIYHS